MQEPVALIADERTVGERVAWQLLGPPLYYCEACLRKVTVKTADDVVTVERPCIGHESHRIIAPRKAIVAGEGGLTPGNKIKQAYWQAAAKLTGRSV